MYGDFMSGMTKFGEAVLIFAAIGAGVGTALALGLGVKI
jgi:hypothetical protein